MKNPTGTKQGKFGSRSGGGNNHVRYDHKSRPKKIDVVCPKCKCRAIAHDNYAHPNYFSVSNLSPHWHESSFNVSCTACHYRDLNISYDQLTEPFCQINGRGEILWAWNLDHLEMIYLFLSDKNIKKHNYKFYETYIHGNWKINKKFYVKSIQTWLLKNKLSFNSLQSSKFNK